MLLIFYKIQVKDIVPDQLKIVKSFSKKTNHIKSLKFNLFLVKLEWT